MKKIFFLFALITAYSCNSYHLKNNIANVYSTNTLDIFVEPNHFTTTDVNKIDKRLLYSFNKYSITKGIFMKGSGLQMVIYGKNSLVNQGYFLVKFKEKEDSYRICILYEVKGRSIIFSSYKIRFNCENWECLKPYLIDKNLMIFY